MLPEGTPANSHAVHCARLGTLHLRLLGVPSAWVGCAPIARPSPCRAVARAGDEGATPIATPEERVALILHGTIGGAGQLTITACRRRRLQMASQGAHPIVRTVPAGILKEGERHVCVRWEASTTTSLGESMQLSAVGAKCTPSV